MTDKDNIPEETLPYFERLRLIKIGKLPKEAIAKPKRPIKKVSEKRAAENEAAKEALGEDDTMKEKWFKARRKEMIGICQCGCGEKSSKMEDAHFRSSICHIFPKGIFESVQYHKINWVERKFWATATSSACHTNMDTRGLDKWPMFADWEDIKERFYQLSPLLTDEERATNFYTKLSNLVYGK